MKIDTITLQCFMAVAETGSFTKAADRVGRTQSAISQQISKLENNLNRSLIIRAKNISLTPEGEMFLGYARRIFILHCEAMDRFKRPDLEGEVRFGLPENFASVYLEGILSDFSRLHPRILVNFECDLTYNLFDKFKKKELDLVMVKMNRPEDFPNGVDVWSEPLKWVGDPSLINQNTPIPLVLSPHPCVYRAAALQALENAARPWRLVFSSPSYASSVAAVKASMGITVMPPTMITDTLHAIETPLLPQLIKTHISLVKHRSDNPAINTLEKFVLRKLSKS